MTRLGRTVPLRPHLVKTGPHKGSYQLKAKPGYIAAVAINAHKSKKSIQETVTKYKKRHKVNGYLSSEPPKKNVIIRSAKATQKRKKAKFLKRLASTDASERTARREAAENAKKLLNKGFSEPFYG